MYLARCLLQNGQGVARVEARLVEVVVLWAVMFCREESMTEFDGEAEDRRMSLEISPRGGKTDEIRTPGDMPMTDPFENSFERLLQ
jgi:hypothetical protein